MCPAALQGLGEKANDSLDMMFDTTAYGEYKSYNSSHFGQSQPCEDDADDDEEEDEDDEKDNGGLYDFEKLQLSLCSLTIFSVFSVSTCICFNPFTRK